MVLAAGPQEQVEILAPVWMQDGLRTVEYEGASRRAKEESYSTTPATSPKNDRKDLPVRAFDRIHGPMKQPVARWYRTEADIQIVKMTLACFTADRDPDNNAVDKHYGRIS
jgi:hypothetical protein